jgi:hypothetical protein
MNFSVEEIRADAKATLIKNQNVPDGMKYIL